MSSNTFRIFSDFLKLRIDRDRQRYGQWILTDSQRFAMMEQISESLAGRISVLQLETLSMRELRNVSAGNPTDDIWKGGFPEIWSNPRLLLTDFFESDIRTYLERDLKSIIEVKNLSNFQRFFRVFPTRVGQLVNYHENSRDVGVVDSKRLIFHKALHMFKERTVTKALLLQNLSATASIRNKEFLGLNPLFTDIELEGL